MLVSLVNGAATMVIEEQTLLTSIIPGVMYMPQIMVSLKKLDITEFLVTML